MRVKIDQVALARSPARVLAEAASIPFKKCAVELGIVYDTRCITHSQEPAPGPLPRELTSTGVLLARPGIGFPGPVHLERFASPARLALTDEPRLASVGGMGMLTLVVSPAQLAEALVTGSTLLRPPSSVQVLLSGRLRPFVCIRDVALELLRRGLKQMVEDVDRARGAPVVLEFGGPSARLLTVSERAVLASLAPMVGAAAGLFLSDEKTETYLRDQRRSKAHRTLNADAGAPSEDVLTVDLSAVDPLLLDEQGIVRPVREFAGRPVQQALLGGDSGSSLRDLLAAAALLKSKRVPPRLDFLFAPPSRQTLELLAHVGALGDLIATGARLLEPDHRVVTGELYPSPAGGTSLRSQDPEPAAHPQERFITTSPETVAYAVATGTIGDPRSFKRPVRISVPRALSTDDVLIERKSKGKAKADGEPNPSKPLGPPPRYGWTAATALPLAPARTLPATPSVQVLRSLEDVRWTAVRAPALNATVRAIIAPHVPADLVSTFASLGILALACPTDELERLDGPLSFGEPRGWDGEPQLAVQAPSGALRLEWRAVGVERDWAVAGGPRPPTPKPPR